MTEPDFSVPRDSWKGNGHKWKYKKINLNFGFFYCEGSWTDEQVSQRDGGASIFGDIQNLDGQRPEQPFVGNLIVSSGVGPDELQISLPASTILLFYMSVYMWVQMCMCMYTFTAFYYSHFILQQFKLFPSIHIIVLVWTLYFCCQFFLWFHQVVDRTYKEEFPGGKKGSS